MYFTIINSVVGFFFLLLIFVGIFLKYHSFLPINIIGILIIGATLYLDRTNHLLPENIILIMLALVIIFITDIIFIFRDFREEVSAADAQRLKRYLTTESNNDYFKMIRDANLIKSDIDLHKKAPLSDRVQALELLKQGNEFFEKGQFQEALEKYDLSCNLVESGIGYLNQSGVLLKSAQYEDSLIIARKAEDFRSNFYEAKINQAVALEKLNRLPDALKKYEEAAKLNPDEYEVWFCEANVLFRMEKYREAVAYYDKSLSLHGRNFDAWYYKGIALQKLNKLVEALRCFEQAVKLRSHHAKIFFRMGNILTALDRDSEAIAAYEKSIRLNSDSEFTWNNLGITLNKIGRIRDAVKCYERAIKLNDNYAEAWFNRALALDTLDKIRKAYESYLRFIQVASEKMTPRVEMAKKRVNEIKTKLKRKKGFSFSALKKKSGPKSKRKKDALK
ncbi:MAG: tetratricopeptide repeat protein [Calditrichaeota bacterium]|nr:tetratricopeptide repeat protein [Calditrichota bacterium]